MQGRPTLPRVSLHTGSRCGCDVTDDVVEAARGRGGRRSVASADAGYRQQVSSAYLSWCPPCLESESESEYLLSQYKFTKKFVLRCTARKRINNRLINTAQQRLKTHQTHTTCYYRSIKKWMFTKASVMRVPAG